MTTAHQHLLALRIPVLDGSGREVYGYREASPEGEVTEPEIADQLRRVIAGVDP